jgi:hypothetical protein
MLEAITDFWKPAKKGQAEEKLDPKQLQVGSTIGFGFVPQVVLSGRRMTVSAINTYQFGEEALTSFILTQDNDSGVSMIVAESEGEHYLALSRRIPLNDRSKLFTPADFEIVLTSMDVTKLPCKENVSDYKGWTVSSYRREIHGMKGRIFKGDFRGRTLPATKEAQEFDYTLLVSESNEHAIEIEKYADGRVEVYATVYRRMNDVGEITHPANGKELAKDMKDKELARPDIKLASEPAKPVVAPAAPAVVNKPVHSEPLELKELAPPAPAPVREEPKAVKTEPKATPVEPTKAPATTTTTVTTNTQTTNNGATKIMSTNAETTMKPKLYVQPTNGEKALTNGVSSFDADALECDLRVANKIIDEAIRNEMRLTDIVRRIIELPVANQESVQIPVTLTDEDYALLAIRYGISSSDRNAIKRRIIEDLNDFGGNAVNGKKAA